MLYPQWFEGGSSAPRPPAAALDRGRHPARSDPAGHPTPGQLLTGGLVVVAGVYVHHRPAGWDRTRRAASRVRRWLAETYPAIRAQARREGGVVLWLDEMGSARMRRRAAPGRRSARPR
jgi:hypothetical protein